VIDTLSQTRSIQELLQTLKSCHESRFDRVNHIAYLREWMASDPICIDLYTCLGNDTPIMPPPNCTSPNNDVIQAVAYRALQCYFRLDNSFLEEAQERMPNLSLSTAIEAIVHDARSRHANNNSSSINDDESDDSNNKKVLVVLAIDEIQHGLRQSDDKTADDPRSNHNRFLLRLLIGDLMHVMARCEPFFVVPMMAGLNYPNIELLMREDCSIQISNLVPAPLSQGGMWQVIRAMYPSSFAATKETINEMPREFLAILAYIGGYPRGFEMWLESAGSVLSRPSSSEWSDALGRELSLSLARVIERLPKPRECEAPVLEPILRNMIWSAMAKETIDISQACKSLRDVSKIDLNGIPFTWSDVEKAPALVVATWVEIMKQVNRESPAINALHSLMLSFTHENWHTFELQTANCVAYLLALSDAGTSIPLAKLLFPFASLKCKKKSSIFSSLQVIVPESSGKQVIQLANSARSCQSIADDDGDNQRDHDNNHCWTFNKGQVVMLLNEHKSPLGDSFVVLQVSNQSRTVEALKELPFFDTKGRSLNQVIENTQEEIDLVVCFQNHHADHRDKRALSPSDIEQEWHKKIMAANECVQRFDRPFVLTMVMVSNRRGSYSTANERQQAIERYNKRVSASGATIDQAVAVEQSPNAKITNDDWKFTEEFRALPRPYVVVAGTTNKLYHEGYAVAPMNGFFPKSFMSMINGM